MKYLIYSDVHWSQYSSILTRRGEKYSLRLENLVQSMNWVNEIASKENCDATICLGDFFDRPDCNCEEITALQDIKWAKMKHLFIVGNHESNVNSLNYSATKIFEGIGARVINSPETITVNDYVDITLIPYITGEVPPIKSFIKNSDKKNIILAHQDVKNVRFGKFVTSDGFDINDIKSDNKLLFIDGHLHNGGFISSNGIIAGNLTGQNFNEDGINYAHNVYIMEISGNNIDITIHKNPFALNFYKFTIHNIDDLNKIKDIIENNCVLSISCDSSVYTQVRESLESDSRVLAFREMVYYDNSNTCSSEGQENFETDDYVDKFINYAKESLDNSDILDFELSLLKSRG